MCEPRDRCALHRLGFALYWRVISKARRVVGRKRDFKGSSGSSLPDGSRESDVGRSAHSRGASDVGIRCFRTNHLPLDETSARDPERAKRWLAFLRNHREAIAVTDFFTVPTPGSACSTASRDQS